MSKANNLKENREREMSKAEEKPYKEVYEKLDAKDGEKKLY